MSLDTRNYDLPGPLDTRDRSGVSSRLGRVPRPLDTQKQAWLIIFCVLLRSTKTYNLHVLLQYARAQLSEFCPRTEAMPPKGSKKNQPNQAVVAAAAPDSVAKLEVKVELPNGEADKANLSYIDLVQKAKDVIDNHPLFRNIESELPLKITANKTESGVQTPFDSEECKHALRAQSKMYTCGVNLFWINFLWSPTPGVPLRCSSIETLSNSKFAEPCVLDAVHVAVLDKDFDPLVHKGSLQRVSPEEITAAIIFTIARDIRGDAPDSILKSWRVRVLSTTCTFILLADSTARYWYALQQRENFTVTHAAMNRSVFQRMHEIHRLMKGMRESHTSSDITSANVTKVYEENIRSGARICSNGVEQFCR